MELPKSSRIILIYLALVVLMLSPYMFFRSFDVNIALKMKAIGLFGERPQFKFVDAEPEPYPKNCFENKANWEFRCKYTCPKIPPLKSVHYGNLTRRQIVPIFKHNGEIELKQETYKNNYSLPVFQFKDERLLRLVNKYCYDGLPVPNVLHYVWLGKKEMNLYHMLSFLASHKFLKPCFIFVHSDFPPYGPFWDYLLYRIPNMIHVNRTDLKYFLGQKIKYVEHKADIVRLLAVKEYGGIYLDTDSIVLQPLDKFRKYNLTLSDTRYFKQKDAHLSNAYIFSVRNWTFINIWLDKYKKYKSSIWGWNSVIMPYLLYLNHSDLVHIEWNYTFLIPRLNDGVDKIFFKMNTDWSKNYAVHFYIRYTDVRPSLDFIRTWNVTAGSVARFILLGTRHLCSN